MTSLSIRLTELDDDQLEQFVEMWAERKSKDYNRVERVGGASDKGRDVIGFLTAQKHEGDWHLFQCKRKTRGSKLGTPEGLVELGKLFYHHEQGIYLTLPTEYVFVSPRGIVGPLRDLINNPSTLKKALIENWIKYCAEGITDTQTVPLTPSLRALIEGYDFSKVSYLSATMIVKDKASGPALTKLLNVDPDEAPVGMAPPAIQPEEMTYIDQLRRLYGEAAGVDFDNGDDVLKHPEYGDHLRDQRTRYFHAAFFERFHRDSTYEEALVAFSEDIYHGVIDVHRKPFLIGLERLNAVMSHASTLQAGLLRTLVKIPVKQGYCHRFANEGRLKWMP